ncbi:arabinogalactan protein 16-like [Arachis stenosperma]|uniref:arabinogalactan protein 16-like n=1 Tax=Arachis stenosperma TaxID=217475 RepID=UPI0025AC6B33|nr:arabinogalactan protein 16-like [Arachis stenosperma]
MASSMRVVFFLGLIYAALISVAVASEQTATLSIDVGKIPTTNANTNDGTTIDQAVGYLLMLLALVLTYLIH